MSAAMPNSQFINLTVDIMSSIKQITKHLFLIICLIILFIGLFYSGRCYEIIREYKLKFTLRSDVGGVAVGCVLTDLAALSYLGKNKIEETKNMLIGSIELYYVNAELYDYDMQPVVYHDKERDKIFKERYDIFIKLKNGDQYRNFMNSVNGVSHYKSK